MSEILTDIEEYVPLETGGSFFGYVAGDDVVVTELIHAGPQAKRTSFCFSPDQEYQLSEMKRLFQLSDGTTFYLGDWHSHPSSSPILSRRDEKTLLKVACSKDALCPHPVMMVFGSCPEKWTIECVRFTKGRRFIWPLYSCNYEKLKIIVD